MRPLALMPQPEATPDKLDADILPARKATQKARRKTDNKKSLIRLRMLDCEGFVPFRIHALKQIP